MRKIILTASDAKKQTTKTETKKLRRRIGELEAQLAEEKADNKKLWAATVEAQDTARTQSRKFHTIESQLAELRPYLQHKHHCARQTNLNYGCDCGLQAAIGEVE